MVRKAKTKISRNKLKEREFYDRVLVVAEGKTEINYFNGLIKHLKLSTVNIEVQNIEQNTPDSLFRIAKKLYKKSKEQRDPYDKVYCIFDKDRHAKYEEIKNTIDQIKNPKDVYRYAFSEPCFEFWLLLHYKKTDAPFTNYDELIKQQYFKKSFPSYNKTDKGIFTKLSDKVDIACQHAVNNRHTNVHELVQYLQGIKKQ